MIVYNLEMNLLSRSRVKSRNGITESENNTSASFFLENVRQQMWFNSLSFVINHKTHKKGYEYNNNNRLKIIHVARFQAEQVNLMNIFGTPCLAKLVTSALARDRMTWYLCLFSSECLSSSCIAPGYLWHSVAGRRRSLEVKHVIKQLWWTQTIPTKLSGVVFDCVVFIAIYYISRLQILKESYKIPGNDREV